MRYTYFEIENFRGIRRARLELAADASPTRVYTLVGLNESGKTTVLEAIDHFQATDEDDPSPKELGGWTTPDPHTLVPIAERTNFNGTVVIRCGVEIEDSDEEAARELLFKEDGFRLASLDRSIVIADQYHFENSRFVKRTSTWNRLQGAGRTARGKKDQRIGSSGANRALWLKLTGLLRPRLPRIWYFPDSLFDFPDKIYLEEYAEETKENRFYRSLFQDVLDALGRDLTIQTHVVERYRSGSKADRENLRQVLLDAGRHVTTSVVSAWNEIFVDKPLSTKRVQIDIDDDPVDELGAALAEPRIWIRLSIEDDDGFFSVHERSRGFRWFFVYLMLTTYRGSTRGDSSDDMLFLFDEPASNLHSTAQAALLGSLRRLSEKAVVIYATHSHHLIEPAWLGSTFVVANQALDPREVSAGVAAKRTDIQVTPYRAFAAGHPNQRYYFQPILDLLDYAPSQLEAIPAVAMVEGKSDYYLLRYAQEVLASTGVTDQVALLPGTGSGNLDELFQLYLGWSRPFVAMLDSDREGSRQAERYKEKFGRIIEGHLTDLATMSGKRDAKAIESLLSDADRLVFQRLVEPNADRYNKKLFGLGVQEALVGRVAVGLSQEARSALGAVLNGLREKLKTVEVALKPD